MADAGARDRTDAAGTEHPRAGAGARVVSLVPSITELLFDLGLGDLVVGRTTFCVHPEPAIDAVPRVGGTKTPRLDRIRALAPTHVVVNVDENRREDAEAIAGFARVVATHPNAPRDNLALYRLIGSIFAAEEAAARLCAAFERAHDALTAAAESFPPARVLYLIWRDPWMTVSRDTYVSRTLALAGWETIGHDPRIRYPEIAIDERVLGEADAVLFSSEPYPFKAKHLDEVRALAGAAAPVLATIDGEMTSWYGSRAVRGLEYLARFVPETLAAA